MSDRVVMMCRLCGRDHGPKMETIATSEGYVMRVTHSFCRPAIEQAASTWVAAYARYLEQAGTDKEQAE